jgi:hypothetical protein
MRFIAVIIILHLSLLSCRENSGYCEFGVDSEFSIYSIKGLKDSLAEVYRTSIKKSLAAGRPILLEDSFNIHDKYWLSGMLHRKLKEAFGINEFYFFEKRKMYCSQVSLESRQKNILHDSIYFAESTIFIKKNFGEHFYDTLRVYLKNCDSEIEQADRAKADEILEHGFASIADTLTKDSIDFTMICKVDQTGKLILTGLHGIKSFPLAYRASQVVDRLPKYSCDKTDLLEERIKIHMTVYKQ